MSAFYTDIINGQRKYFMIIIKEGEPESDTRKSLKWNTKII